MNTKPHTTFARNRNLHEQRRRHFGRFEQLETRELMHGSGLHFDDYHDLPEFLDRDEPAVYVAYDGALAQGGSGFLFGEGGVTKNLTVKGLDARTLDETSGLPMLDSNPNAPVTIHLDFTGNFIGDWWYNSGNSSVHYYNLTTPVFSLDNVATFNTDEQNLIREIWARVAEDFSPFNVNVSTAYYGTFENGKALKVNIGGSNMDWLGENSSGFASIGSFADNAPNQVFVFDLAAWARAGVTDGDGNLLNAAAAIATTATHEAGHAFGLRHHARYAFDGTKITDYDPGTNGWTPIMGDNLAGDRTTWDAGPTDLGAGTMQDDVAVLARSIDGFGLRADDFSNSRSTAFSLQSNEVGLYTGKGIIEQRLDYDVFKFTTQGGTVSITVNAAKFGPNLVPVAELYSTAGFVSSATGGNWTQSIITKNLPAGTYYLQVRGFQDHGSMGQYTFSISTQLSSTTTLLTTTSTTTATTTSTTFTPSINKLSTTKSTSTLDAKSSGGAGSPLMISESPTLPLDEKQSAKPDKLVAARDAVFEQWDGELLETLLDRKRGGTKLGRN